MHRAINSIQVHYPCALKEVMLLLGYCAQNNQFYTRTLPMYTERGDVVFRILCTETINSKHVHYPCALKEVMLLLGYCAQNNQFYSHYLCTLKKLLLLLGYCEQNNKFYTHYLYALKDVMLLLGYCAQKQSILYTYTTHVHWKRWCCI